MPSSPMDQNNEAARREYWTEQMEAGYEFVQEILAYDEVEECGEGFASIPDCAEEEGVEMLFSESKIAGDLERVFYMRESLVADLIAVGADMNERGWILKIEDGFRSKEMQSQLVRKPEVFDSILQKCLWENSGVLPSTEMVFRRAIVMIANIPKIGTHMSGSAIDVSVFQRSDRTEVSRGYPYLEVSEHTPMRSPFVDDESLRNRLEITEMMESRGFVHFPFEFWHFNKDDAMGHLLSGRLGPAKFGPVHWNPETNAVVPYSDPMAPLNPLDQIEKEIAAAMERVSRVGV